MTQEALAAELPKHQAHMMRVAAGVLRNQEDAEECVQDAFLKAWQHADQFRGESGLATWLHRIVWNVAVMRIRSENYRGRGRKVEVTDSCLVTSDSAESAIAARERRVAVAKAICRLDPKYRDALLLCLAGEPLSNTDKTHKFRAIRQIQGMSAIKAVA